MVPISAFRAGKPHLSAPQQVPSPWYLPAMHFTLVDRFLELSDTSAIAVKNVTAAEEYLQDHFPGFPVLPGVFMVEALTQAARAVLEKSKANIVGIVLNDAELNSTTDYYG
jgi:3-hydroxymyristoyl/3-hydroxydecanoyl-(acyl carrier protein) dehydratase